jgi:Ca2+/Na+ antiporter
VTPLEVPKGTIPLVDPIANPKDGVLMRDLFFSGHTATTFVAFLVCRRQHMRWKLLLGFIAFVTAIMVLIQKTHYSIDVLSAPFFVHGSHTMTKELRRLCGLLYQVDEEKTQAKVEQKEKTI